MKHSVLTCKCLSGLSVEGHFIEICVKRQAAAHPYKHESSLQVWASTQGTGLYTVIRFYCPKRAEARLLRAMFSSESYLTDAVRCPRRSFCSDHRLLAQALLKKTRPCGMGTPELLQFHFISANKVPGCRFVLPDTHRRLAKL